MWLHSAKVKVERLLLLKTNGVDPCSVLEKERRKRDKGVALRVQAFWVRRACLGVSLGCRAYSGRPGYQGNYTIWAKRGDLGETAQHFGEVTDWLEATLCSCYPSVPCYPQDTHPPNLHMHFADVCPKVLKPTGHAINTPQCCLSHLRQVHCYQNWLCCLFLHPLLESNYFYNPRTFV